MSTENKIVKYDSQYNEVFINYFKNLFLFFSLLEIANYIVRDISRLSTTYMSLYTCICLSKLSIGIITDVPVQYLVYFIAGCLKGKKRRNGNREQ